MEVQFNEYIISDDKSRIDINIVLDYLSRSYWANKRPKERTIQAIENSRCFGVYFHEKQVGFARVVTDNSIYVTYSS